MKVAAAQMVSCSDVKANFERVRIFMEKARASGVNIIVFPETFLSFGTKIFFDTNEQRRLMDMLSGFAREYGVWIVAGTMPLNATFLAGEPEDNADVKPTSTSVIFDSQGNFQGAYSKIHLFDADVDDQTKIYRESERYCPGVDIPVFQGPGADFGVTICYDLRFAEIFLHFAQTSCKVIFIPSAFTEKTGRAHWEVLIRARAIETQCFIVAANQGGVHTNGQRTWGHSMIVNPWGEILSKVEMGEGLAVAELDMDQLEHIRSEMPIRQHRRVNLR